MTAAYVSCHWREQQAGRLLAYDLAKAAAAGGRVKLAAARPLVVGDPACGLLLRLGHVPCSACGSDYYY